MYSSVRERENEDAECKECK